jgi:hypothetical protein
MPYKLISLLSSHLRLGFPCGLFPSDFITFRTHVTGPVHPIFLYLNILIRTILRRRSAAARLLGLRVRIPLGAWMSVCCECCVLSGRGLLWMLCVVRQRSLRRADHPSRGVLPTVVCLAECDREAKTMKRPRSTRGCCAMEKKYLLFGEGHKL